MVTMRRAVKAEASPAHRGVLALLAAALLLTSFTGHAGVQVLDRDFAARLFPYHLHGVPGEREYVERYHEPAPFVPGHCHSPLVDPAQQPGPDEVQAAASLAGVSICTDWTALPAAAPPPWLGAEPLPLIAPHDLALRPAPPPPQF